MSKWQSGLLALALAKGIGIGQRRPTFSDCFARRCRCAGRWHSYGNASRDRRGRLDDHVVAQTNRRHVVVLILCVAAPAVLADVCAFTIRGEGIHNVCSNNRINMCTVNSTGA